MKLLNQMMTVFIFSFLLIASPSVDARAKPDLKVSKITTVGGLCIGKKNKVRVTVVNTQQAGVSQKIPVILFVTIPGKGNSSYVGYLKNGIGPNNNSGLPVWFNEVDIPAKGQLTIKAVVNPDQEVLESVYNNNTKIYKHRGASNNCGSAPAPAAGAKLTVNAYVPGTWVAGSGTAISNVHVIVKKPNNQTIASGTTNSSGKVVLNNIPKGSVKIIVSKPGCATTQESYTMPKYDAKKNIALPCN